MHIWNHSRWAGKNGNTRVLKKERKKVAKLYRWLVKKKSRVITKISKSKIVTSIELFTVVAFRHLPFLQPPQILFQHQPEQEKTSKKCSVIKVFFEQCYLQIGRSGWLTGHYNFRCQPVDYSNHPSTLRVIFQRIIIQFMLSVFELFVLFICQ